MNDLELDVLIGLVQNARVLVVIVDGGQVAGAEDFDDRAHRVVELPPFVPVAVRNPVPIRIDLLRIGAVFVDFEEIRQPVPVGINFGRVCREGNREKHKPEKCRTDPRHGGLLRYQAKDAS